MEKISVIVPVYNVEKYLHRCIDSILSQTYRNLEIILVNDGSTDNSGEICEWYKEQDKRIKVIHKKNGGQSSARNAGLEIATGEYVAFVDSDDWIIDNMYEYLLGLIKKTESDVATIDFIFARDETENKYRYSKKKINIKVYENKEILREYLIEGTIRGSYSFCRNLYKRKLFKNVKFPNGKINEDIVTNYKVLMNAKRQVKSNYIGYFYFQGGVSTTRAGLRKKDFDLLDASKELVNLTQNESYKDIKYLAEVKLARSYFSLLAKIAFYGIDDKELNEKEIIGYLTRKLRGNYLFLVKSPMPLNRKLMMTLLCININFLKIPLKIYKKL